MRNYNLKGANLNDANLNGASLIRVKNLTPSQIKSACYWKKAFYKGNYDQEKNEWIINETANQEFIKDLVENTASDPQEPVDCSRWE